MQLHADSLLEFFQAHGFGTVYDHSWMSSEEEVEGLMDTSHEVRACACVRGDGGVTWR